MLRVQGVGAEGVQRIHVDERPEVFVVHLLDFRDLMGGAEAVEEVHEGHARLDGGEVRHAREVHDFLDRAGGDHAPAGLAAVIDVRVVAEDGQGMGAHGPGGHVQHGGVPLARNAVHGGDHEHEALGGRVARGERAGLRRAVDGRDGAGLRLHLHQPDGLTEDVGPPVGGPHVGLARHGRGRGYGIDGGHFREGVGDIRRGLIAVHRYKSLG